MDELILKLLRGLASDSERQRVAEWRRTSPENEGRYQQMAVVWRRCASAGDRRPVGAAPTPAQIVARAERRRTVRTLQRLAVAAVVTLAVIGAGWFSFRWINTPLMAVAAEGDQTITLPDGSFVRLADGSRLEYRARRGRRLVHLAGRAFFAVASDSTHPFRISAGAATVSVLGTRFDVRPSGDSVRVAVVEGQVALSRRNATERLTAGIVGVAHPSGVTIALGTNATDAVDWTRPFFLFHDATVSDVVGEVSARLNGRVDVVDSVIATRLVTAQFTDESFDDIMSTICVVVNARCTTIDGVLRMSR